MNKENLVKKLSEEQDIASWKDLRIHSARDAILLVANGINLAEVGAEFALDNKELVSIWVTDRTIRKPDAEFLNAMEADLEKKYSFIIVQPFVLIQELVN